MKVGLGVYLHQLRVLMQKNWWLILKNWKITLIQLGSPIVFVVVLFLLQLLYNYVKSDVKLPVAFPLSKLPKCITSSNGKCITILYTPGRGQSKEIDAVMDIIARRNSLTISNETISFQDQNFNINSLSNDIYSIQNETSIEKFIFKFPNVTQAGIKFQSPTTWGKIFAPYIVLFNSSGNGPNVLSQMMRTIDEAILERYSVYGESSSIDISVKGFPKVLPSSSGESVVGLFGAFWFYCPPMFNFIILLNQIVTENELQLRLSMSAMGLKNSVYWLSWFITNTIINILATLILILFGYIFQIALFLNTNILVTFLTFFFFSTSMVPAAFLLSAFVSRAKTATTIGFIVFVFGLIVQTMFASMAIYFWYLKTTSKAFQYIFMFYPPYNFAKLFADISQLSIPKFNPISGDTSVVNGYSLPQLFQPIHIPFYDIDSPPDYLSLIFLTMNGIIFMILAWYFDNVIPTPRKSPWFFFEPSYWGISFRRSTKNMEVTAIELQNMSEDVIREMNKPYDPTFEGIRIMNLGKSYQSFSRQILNRLSCGRYKDKVSLRALSNFFLEIARGECLCLLGHNGAGKTTLVNILTGLFKPSNGDAIIFGHSLSSQDGMDRIRSLSGVCPQHDILFQELSAWQHLELFAQLKGINAKTRSLKIEHELKKVQLYGKRNDPVGSFSGGMKRRLSLAISCIGDPKIMFLDEPSTGLDPLSKRKVWDLINDMKRDRVVILTTHSMEECDFLADRIAIMGNGRIKCLGNSLNLKNRFGEGYYFNFILNSVNDVDNFKMVIQQICNEMILEYENSTSLKYRVKNKSSAIVSLFRNIEEKRIIGIKDWSISNASLEDVFLNVEKL